MVAQVPAPLHLKTVHVLLVEGLPVQLLPLAMLTDTQLPVLLHWNV